MKSILKISILVLLLSGSTNLFAQHGFGTNNPNAQAAMDIVSPDKGILIPRVNLTSSTLFLGGVTPDATHTSMLVFNTNTDTATTGLTGTGFYFWTTTGPSTGTWTAISTGSGIPTPSATDTNTLNNTLRWDGTAWVESDALKNDGTDVTASGQLATLNFSTMYTTTPTIDYKVNDVVLHEGVFYRNVSSTLATSTTPSGTTNAAVWQPITGEDADNIYTADGTLTASRTVNLDGNDLSFSNTATSVLKIDTSDERVYVGATTAFAGTSSYSISISDNLTGEDLDLVVEGDLKARFILDENNEVGNAGEVLTRTASGLEWRTGGGIVIETITESAGISAGTTLLLVEPSANTTVAMPNTTSPNWPIGTQLKIKRNGDYSGINDLITLSGTGTASIDGATSRNLNTGFQSISLIATATGWIQID